MLRLAQEVQWPTRRETSEFGDVKEGRMIQQNGEELQARPENRHIQLIALGGAIGTGLFLGIADTIKMAGPPSCWLRHRRFHRLPHIMRQLGEMVVESRLPVLPATSPTSIIGATSLVSPPAGTTGALCAGEHGGADGGRHLCPVLVARDPDLDVGGLLFVLISAINLSNVKAFGEMEF